MSVGAIRAGRAFVELLADDTKFAKGLKAAEAKLKAWGSAIGSLSAKVMGAGLAMTAPLLAAAKSFSSFGDEIAKMAKRTGLSVEALSELQYVASQSGTDVDTFEKAIAKMQRSIVEAGQGTKTAVDSLAMIGLSVKQLSGLTPEKQFDMIARALSQVQDPAVKTAAAFELFGKSGTKLIPMLSGGSAGIESLRQKARDFGFTMSSEAARAAEDLNDSLDTLFHGMKMIAVTVGGALAPLFTDLGYKIATAAKGVGEWINANRSVVESTLKIGVGLLAAGAAIKAVSVAVTGLSSALGVLRLAATASGFVAILAGAVAASAAIQALSGSMHDLAGETQRATAAGDEKRAADIALLERLEALSKQQKLTTGEMDEAKNIIGQLTATYGNLGVQIDEATGRITGFTEAQKNANKAMQEAAKAQVAAEIKAIEKDLSGLQHDFDNPSFARSFNAFFGSEEGGFVEKAFGYMSGEEIQKEIEVKNAQLEAARKRLAAIATGDKSAVTGGRAAAPVSPMIPEIDTAEDGAKKRAAIEEKAAEDLRRARLDSIAEEHVRERMRIHQEYAQKIEEAKKAGASIADLEKARDQELANLKNRIDAENEKERLAAKDREREKVREIKDYEKGLDVDIERARIDLMEDGAAKRKAELDLEKRKAMDAAIAAGADTSRVEELYMLKAQALAKGIDTTGESKSGLAISGTFSAAAAMRGAGAANATVAAIDRQTEILRRIEQKTKPAIWS